MTYFANPIFLPLDTSDIEQAASLARQLKDYVGGVKIGLEFFYANGRAGYEKIAATGVPVFLDLKLHDIPNQVAGSLRALMRLEPLPVMVNVHAGGGADMMRAAADAVDARTKLIGVTILTSLDNADIAEIGFDPLRDTLKHVISMAELARTCGLDGVVCSPRDIESIKAATAPDFLTIVPGIRPPGSFAGDQKRIATPGAATKAGADVLVVGRPITQSADPVQAARTVYEQVVAARG